jgi:hypothetical protein
MATRLLFHRADIFDLLEHQRASLKEEVGHLDAAALQNCSQDEIVHLLTTKYKLELPLLDEESAELSHRDVHVDVSQDPMRLILDRGRAFYIPGVEITFSVPFRGDPLLFDVRPSTFSTNPPIGDIKDREIQLTFTRTDKNAAAAKSDYEQVIKNIRQHLDWLRNSIEEFNTKIGGQVDSLVNQRRQQLSATADMIASIGLPVKHEPSSPDRINRADTRQLQRSIASPKKWDVFISHAGEDKVDIARPLAEALSKEGVSVWFDEFSLKVGDSLRTSIDYGLANSRYGVVILSKKFFAKHWPVQELNGLASRETNSRKLILPIWHKVNVEEVREFSPILADRVAAKSEDGLERLVEQVTGVLRAD